MKLIKLFFVFIALALNVNFAYSQGNTNLQGVFLANQNEFPYIVKLFSNTGSKYLCSGALISKRWVLTAAHCIQNTGFYVNIISSSSGSENINPELLKYPTTGNSDIVLVKLSRDVTSATPIKLPNASDENLLVRFTRLTAVGWLATKYYNIAQSDNLLRGEMSVFPQDQCSINYSGKTNVSINKFCAEADTNSYCVGDGGSPLILKGSSESYLVGITSFGLGLSNGYNNTYCGGRGYPGVYNNIFKHLAWIQVTSGIGKPAKVQFNTPSGITVNAGSVISWKSVSGADSYLISGIVNDHNYATNVYSDTTTSTSYTLPVNLQGYHSITVTAKSGTYMGDASEALKLNVFNTPSTSAITSPTNSQRLPINAPVITWRKTTNTSYYKLTVINIGTGARTNINDIRNEAYAFSENLTPGKYALSVQSINGTRVVTSPTSYFYVNLPTPVVNAVTANTNKRPVISWLAVSGATSYRIYFENITTRTVQDIKDITNTSYTHNTNMASGSYRVYLMAVNSHTNSLWSAVKTFSINFDAPTFNITNLTSKRPLVSWSAVQGAPKYEIYIRSVTTPSDVISAVTSSLSYTPTRDLRTGAQDVWMRVVAPGVVGNWSAPKRVLIQ